MPQLPTPFAQPLAAELCTLTVEECKTMRSVDHSNRIYSPTGGVRIDEQQYAAMRDELALKAEEAGYPKDNMLARLMFDAEAAIFLHKKFLITDNEAEKDGVWNFLCCVALPDLVRWRWVRGDKEFPQMRFLAGRKNTFERLWWRAQAYYDPSAEDPYWLVREIGEDESVGIMERTTLSGIRPLVLAVLRSLLKAYKTKPTVARSELMRDGMKRLRRLGGIVAFETLDKDDLSALCDSVFADSVAALTPRR